VHVLGGLRVLRNGVALGGSGGKGQKKPLELLVLLAAHPQGLANETLIDALWPSLETSTPRASLEITISRLRKWLDCADAVRVADGRVGLHPQLVWVDVAAFEQAALGGDAEAALAAYRGPLLHGERLAGLAQAAREQLAYRLAAVLLQAVAALRADGRHSEALALLGRGLAVETGQAALLAAMRV
jgi:DNA-binding SARP family transcriptional activator